MSEEASAAITPGEQGATIVSNNETSNFSIPNKVSDPTGSAAAEAQRSYPELSDIIPGEYRDKPYMSKIKDVPALFKAFDNAQQSIGKKPTVIPDAGGPKEAWDDLYNQLGRPQTPEGYQIDMPQELAKGLEENKEQLDQFKGMAHELGLNNKQVQALVDYDIKRQTQAMGQYEEHQKMSQKQLDDEFDKLGAETFGDRLDAAIDNSKKLLNKYAPKSFTDKILSLDNNSLIALTSVLDGVTRDYISEDKSIRGDSSVARSQDELLSEAHNLMQSEAFRNPIHVDHETANKRVQGIYEQLYGGTSRR